MRAPSTQVDHVQPLADFPDLALVRSNLQGLCDSCHAKKRRAKRSLDDEVAEGLPTHSTPFF